jgi:hypothetical protein
MECSASEGARVRLTRRLAPVSFVVFAAVAALKDGLKASAPQSIAANGLDTLSVAPNVEVSVESVPPLLTQ